MVFPFPSRGYGSVAYFYLLYSNVLINTVHSIPRDVNHDVPLPRANDEVGHVSHRRACGGTKLVNPREAFFVDGKREAVQRLDNLNKSTNQPLNLDRLYYVKEGMDDIYLRSFNMCRYTSTSEGSELLQ